MKEVEMSIYKNFRRRINEPPPIILNADHSISINFQTSPQGDPDNKSYISFSAKPIFESEDVSRYLKVENFCTANTHNYSYIPFDVEKIFEVLNREKTYGVIDFLEQCNGVAVTILQRCHNSCIDVSIPIIFIYSNSDECNTKTLQGNGYKRQILSIIAPQKKCSYRSRQMVSEPVDPQS